MIIADLLTKAKKLNNFDDDATGGGLWTDTTHYRATVPAGKRWFLYGGITYRDAAQTVAIYLYDSSGNILLRLGTEASATGLEPYPIEADIAKILFPYVMDAGEYVEAVFGGAQGVGAWCTCVVLEVGI